MCASLLMPNTPLNKLGLKGVKEINKNASGAFIRALHNNLERVCCQRCLMIGYLQEREREI